MENKKRVREICLIVGLTVFVTALLIWSIVFDKESPTALSREYYNYFDTVTVISDYSGGGQTKFEASCEKIEDSLDYYHKLFDIYNEYDGITNIATINRKAGEGAVAVNEDLIDFLEYSIEMYELTGGEVNIAMGAVLSIWHDHREEGLSVPSEEALLSASAHCDIGSIIINRENLTVELVDPKMSLDVGAIAKGYTAEKIADMLIADGVSSCVIDLGGNLRAVGTKPDGSGWMTGIRNPDKSAEASYVHSFELSDGSAVTSGDYERYYVVDGVKYHHIIDKDTLRPAAHFTSVTVICTDSGLADALSTALFSMTYEEGLALIDTLDGVEVVWVLPDGRVIK